jgi:aminopeptidase N
MENTSTLFNTRYVVDSIEDRSYTNVNAHELAHQWFGNLVTESGTPLVAGRFRYHYALLAEKEIYGEDHFYSKLYESVTIKICSRTDTIPVLNAKASSLISSKGAWALLFYTKK